MNTNGHFSQPPLFTDARAALSCDLTLPISIMNVRKDELIDPLTEHVIAFNNQGASLIT